MNGLLMAVEIEDKPLQIGTEYRLASSRVQSVEARCVLACDQHEGTKVASANGSECGRVFD